MKDMSNETIKEKFETFKGLLAYNFKAMDSLANIRLGLEENRNSNAEGLFYGAVESVKDMIGSYQKLAELDNQEVARYVLKLEDLERKGAGAVARMQYARKFGYDNSSVLDEASKNLFGNVENLSRAIADSENPGFLLENVSTLHDMVRYVHQKGLDTIFKPDDVKGLDNVQVYNFGHLYFNLQNIGDGLTSAAGKLNREDINCEPLEEIIKSYESFEHKKKPSRETVNAVIDKNFINAHLKLGCHSADLTSLLSETDSFVDLAYNESGFVNSDRRREYVAKCLEHLGFKVKQNKKQLKASFRDRSKAPTVEALHGATRVLLTCLDLDLSGYLDSSEDVKDTFDYFVSGGANPKEVLKFKHYTDAILARDFNFNETLAQLEHTLKPKLKGIDAETARFVQGSLRNRLASKFSEREDLDISVNAILSGEYLTPKPANLVVVDSGIEVLKNLLPPFFNDETLSDKILFFPPFNKIGKYSYTITNMELEENISKEIKKYNIIANKPNKYNIIEKTKDKPKDKKFKGKKKPKDKGEEKAQ